MRSNDLSSFTRELFLALQNRKSAKKAIVHTFVNNGHEHVPEAACGAYVQNLASISLLEAKIVLGPVRFCDI